MDKRQIQKNLQIIPGVGKSIANDLFNIGIRSIEDLKEKDPQKLYEKICAYEGGPVDRCVLYVCRSSVYFANHKKHDPEKLKWCLPAGRQGIGKMKVNV